MKLPISPVLASIFFAAGCSGGDEGGIGVSDASGEGTDASYASPAGSGGGLGAEETPETGQEDNPASGGTLSASGGTAGIGGSPGSGGQLSTGGAHPASGGAASSGGANQSSGGASQASGGAPSAGGAPQASGGAASSGGQGSGGDEQGPGVQLPPANEGFDYQIGRGYTPPAGVTIVSRDREDSPAAGIYNICYVNGFQAQPDDDDFWLDEHPELVLRDGQGDPVIDEDWDEMLLDTTTDAKRSALAEVVGAWIDACAEDGFDAVEVDNLDTYSRSGGLISEDDNVAFMRLLSERGHAAGLAMGQKNSAEILDRADEMLTDFAVAEECNRYRECGDYTAVYGALVFVIEYRDQDFTYGCNNFPQLSIVRRDVNVTTPQSNSYVFDGC